VVVDDFSTGKHENLAPWKNEIEIVEGSIENLELLSRAFKGADYVLHQAALPSVPRSIKLPLATHNINMTGTLNVLLAARDNGVKRVVCASSSSVYGNQKEDQAKIESMRTQALSPYALTKLGGEEYARIFYEMYGLETVSLRYFNVFGPRQDPASAYAAVIPKFIHAALTNSPATIHGDGMQSRDFTYVTNNVSANLLACTAPAEKVAGKVFNIAAGDNITLLDLLSGIEKNMGVSIEKVFENPREGDIHFSQADITKATKALNYKVDVAFEEGLMRTIEWFEMDKDK
jgi:UDP-glucose 4-epimerase